MPFQSHFQFQEFILILQWFLANFYGLSAEQWRSAYVTPAISMPDFSIVAGTTPACANMPADTHAFYRDSSG